jgi:hypothetical protein
VLVHPVAFEEFRKHQLEWASMMEEAGKSDIPINSGPSMLQAIFGVKDRRELEKLPSTEMLRRWLCVASREARPDSTYTPPQVTHIVIGEVEESDSVTHVIFRETERGGLLSGDSIPSRNNVRLVTVRRDGQVWKIMLNGGIVFDEGGAYGIGIVDDDEPQSGEHRGAANRSRAVDCRY